MTVTALPHHAVRGPRILIREDDAGEWWIETYRGVALEGPFPSRELACVAIVDVIRNPPAAARAYDVHKHASGAPFYALLREAA